MSLLNNSQSLFIIGKLGAPHSINGALKAYFFSDSLDNILKYPYFYIKESLSFIKEGRNLLSITSLRPRKNSLQNNECVITISQYINDNTTPDFIIDNRESAQEFTNQFLYIKKEWLRQSKDEWLINDCIGLEIIDKQEKIVGKVISYRSANNLDFFEITFHDEVLMVPATKEFWEKPNLKNKTIQCLL